MLEIVVNGNKVMDTYDDGRIVFHDKETEKEFLTNTVKIDDESGIKKDFGELRG